MTQTATCDPATAACTKDNGNAGDAYLELKNPEAHENPTGASGPGHNKTVGKRGEDAAARFLYRRGYDILDRNWKCAAGEADIVVLDENVLVFVEVKTRKDTEKGFPSESVTAAKRDKYERIALAYVANHDLGEKVVRFDVVSVVICGPNRALLKHHINAFAAD